MELAGADIFNHIRKTAGREFLLRVSAVEIYNEVRLALHMLMRCRPPRDGYGLLRVRHQSQPVAFGHNCGMLSLA